jgi:hypothetical protein
VLESEESRKNVIDIAETTKQIMQLKVVHLKNNNEKVEESAMKIFFVNRREESFEKFFDMVCQEFFPADKSRENLRLRAYNV